MRARVLHIESLRRDNLQIKSTISFRIAIYHCQDFADTALFNLERSEPGGVISLRD